MKSKFVNIVLVLDSTKHIISGKFFEHLREDIQKAREMGVTLIPHICYHPPIRRSRDNYELVSIHLGQLQEIVTENADVMSNFDFPRLA